MKKQALGICIVILMLIALISGCTEESSSDTASSEPKTVTMNAQELIEDTSFEMLANGMKTDFKSLKEGDTLILQDTITSISYDETTDLTTIEFEYEEGQMSSTTTLLVDGNVTDSYQVGDTIKATLKIKHVTATLMGATIDMEIYEEYWVSQEYFENNYTTGNPYKGIPETKLEKI